MRPALLKRKILNAGAIAISYFKLIPDLFRLNKRSLVLDCGANVGHISRLLSITGATVIAFEPDPIALVLLRKRCGRSPNITIVPKGVWHKSAILPLYTHKDASSNEASFTVGSSINASKINVDTDRANFIEVIDLIEYMLSQPKKIDLVKLDIEGAEIEILHKIISLDAHRLFNRMYVETHETKIPGQAEELEKIKRAMKSENIENIKLNWI